MIWKPAKHHRMALHHLLEHRSAALFAGMGLGKTACALTAFHGLKMMGLARAMLVVAPLRVAALQWPNEIDQWDHLRGLRWVHLRHRKNWEAKADIYLINYEQLIRYAKGYLKHHRSFPFDVVCYDESTAAKSPGSKRINAVRKRLVPVRGVHTRWAMTGTPTPNSLLELFGQIRLVDDGERLGTAFDNYRTTYFEAQDYMQYRWEPRPGARDKIYGRISDITLSLPSEEYSGLPTPRTHDMEVPLPENAREQYNELSKELLLLLENDKEIVAINAAVLAGKLRQITGGTVYDEERNPVRIHAAKLEALQTLVAKVNQPVIIVCNFRHERARILRYIKGSVGFTDTPEFLSKWNRGEIPALVVDPHSVSHGLNMQHGGHVIIWFSLTWSREQYDQLIGRLARPGQKHIVDVYRLLCSGTIDDAIAETLRLKAGEHAALKTTLRNYQRLLA